MTTRTAFFCPEFTFHFISFAMKTSFLRRVSELFARKPLTFALTSGAVWFFGTWGAIQLMPDESSRGIAAFAGVISFVLFTYLMERSK